jgi:hypothetical protein
MPNTSEARGGGGGGVGVSGLVVVRIRGSSGGLG